MPSLKRYEITFKALSVAALIAAVAYIAYVCATGLPPRIKMGRASRASAEISNIDTTLLKMLNDVGLDDFSGRKFFSQFPDTSAEPDPVEAALEIYTETFYILLRDGRAARGQLPEGVELNPDLSEDLGVSYMDLGNDPWGKHKYRIYPGPWRADEPVPFRVYDRDDTVPPRPELDGHEVRQIDREGNELSPPKEVGTPAGRDRTAYIYSLGANRESNQLFDPGYDPTVEDLGPDFAGGGDDINNWDYDKSWFRWYDRLRQ